VPRGDAERADSARVDGRNSPAILASGDGCAQACAICRPTCPAARSIERSEDAGIMARRRGIVDHQELLKVALIIVHFGPMVERQLMRFAMYMPPHFKIDELGAIHAAMRKSRLATLVTAAATG